MATVTVFSEEEIINDQSMPSTVLMSGFEDLLDIDDILPETEELEQIFINW
ncbi:hypothetical protein V6B16_05215 [Salinimicrobium catena]|uniref:hypothetical protein n=1 Tax=Salinimicrobium catena TaxID=390640 RepID=UPI002FE4C08A